MHFVKLRSVQIWALSLDAALWGGEFQKCYDLYFLFNLEARWNDQHLFTTACAQHWPSRPVRIFFQLSDRLFICSSCLYCFGMTLCGCIIIIIIINPLTAKVVGVPHIIHNQFSSFFSFLHSPLGPAETHACLFPDVVFPPLPLSVLEGILEI